MNQFHKVVWFGSVQFGVENPDPDCLSTVNCIGHPESVMAAWLPQNSLIITWVCIFASGDSESHMCLMQWKSKA